jgi:hypothetical protein
MNDDYLWDKSGEPDPEIQQLEEILGTLLYQPRPLEIPDDLLVHRRRNFFPPLAVAATFVIALLAAGLWWHATSQKTRKPEQARVDQSLPVATATKEPDRESVAIDNTSPKPSGSQKLEHRHKHQSANALASNSKRRTNSTTPGLSTAEQKEAFAAKAQLMMALRVASEKLSLAQRKMQGTVSPNQIRNQHKIG